MRRAAQDCGGVERLAQETATELPEVEHWLFGDSLPPVALFLKVLDIVAQGPLREVRVCVLGRETSGSA